MKIKFVKNAAGIGYGYMENALVDVNESFGNEMLELGYAVIIHKQATELPENFPGRKILIENGFETIDEIKRLSVDELQVIRGIGKKLAESIYNFGA